MLEGDIMDLKEIREANIHQRKIAEENDRKAVAIGLNDEGEPEVIAIGRGDLAGRIIRKAKEEGIPVERDPELAESLAKVRVGARVPDSLYDLVIALINYTWKLDESLRKRIKRKLK